MSVDASRARSTGPFRPDGRLRDLVAGDGRVALDRQLDDDGRRIGEELLELADLLLRVTDEVGSEVEILALHLELHRVPLSARALRPMNLPHGPREAHDVDAARAGLAKRRGGGVHRLPARIDVVDEADARRSRRRWRRTCRGRCRDGRRARGRPGAGAAPCARWASTIGHAPAPAQLSGERGRRMLAALERAVGIRRHGHERRRPPGRATTRATSSAATDARPRSPRSFQLRTSARAASSYDDRRPRRRERQPPSRALAAATDRPRRRRAAALAERQRDAAQARRGTSRRAASPGLRQTTHRRGKSRSSTPHRRVGREAATRLRQLCEKTRSASSSCSRSPMSYHWPGTCQV